MVSPYHAFLSTETSENCAGKILLLLGNGTIKTSGATIPHLGGLSPRIGFELQRVDGVIL